MPRLSLVPLMLVCAMAPPAYAHMVWLERDGGTVQLYFGEYGEGVRERTGAVLDSIKAPRLLGVTAAPTRQPDHVAFAAPAGDARAIEEFAPRDDRRRGGRTRTLFLAREGRTDTAAALDLELVPLAAQSDRFTLLFRGAPLPKKSVELIGPPGWTKALQTDNEGQVTLPLPWAGRYVVEIQHLAETPGGEGAAAFDRSSYVSTLSFKTDSGVQWTAPR